ncbi:NirD/YgiW/YdeI family stress tolerance protein [Maribellus maritimus]|uniref:NirD/YgiW/YdeI family stress tolerance protein n=1 Tax=Maribellus maritimus TaxID=2870838 RepID=UPI001EECE7BF|nr:NirD/YgiW/YdeI family stress tolerance protein [Maribellus maritimus]MCG6188466.1 NirD/YgiW/YdeI family stress tolerance protein [Maribellus maritimus]
MKTIKKTFRMIFITAFFAAICSMGYAQYTGPGSKAQLYKVKDASDQALKLDRKDTMVKLQGYVVEQITEDNYWFQDSSGRIKIEIEKKHMPAEPFNDKTEITIVGEIDYDLLEGTEFEVKHITIGSTKTPSDSADTTTAN